MANLKWTPENGHTLNCHLTLFNCAEALEWYKKAFAAKEVSRMKWPNSEKIMHAQLIIGDSILMVNEEFPEKGCLSAKTIGNTPLVIMMYVEDVDQAFDKAVKAGAEVLMPVTDMFWGDRYSQILDPYGNKWALATRKEAPTPEEMAKRQEQFFKQYAGSHK